MDIQEHYVANRFKLVKRMTFRAGTQWDAEDIVQQAYEYALRYYKPDVVKDINPWMSTILNNALREFKNSEKGVTTSSFEEEEFEGTPCTHYPSRVMAEIHELISTKSVLQIEVLNLYIRQEYTARDISRITPYSYAVCHQIIQRFRNELKELYRE